MGLKRKAFLGLVTMGALGAGFAATGASTEEQIIANAKRYTVKITATNRIALNEDEPGFSEGTGFLVDRERGWIITNAHVATRSPSTITLHFRSDDPISATRLHVDPVLDLAVLQIDPDQIPTQATVAELECSVLPTQGTRVIAYGNPGDMNHIASQGIVTGMRNYRAADLVMTDAEITHGSSGSPLIRVSDGKVVGLLSSMDTTNDTDTDADDTSEELRMNFAEPIPSVCRVLDMLRQGRDPRVRHLGVAIAQGAEDLRPVIATASADQPDLRIGDLIVSVNGSGPIDSAGELFDLLRGAGPNVRLTVRRSGEGLKAVSARTYPAADPLEAKGVSFSGLVISEPWIFDETTANPNRYLRVHSVEPSAPLEISVVDLVEAVDGRTFTSSTDLHRYLSGLDKGAQVRLILRTQVTSEQFYYLHKIVDVPVMDLKLLDASGGAWDFNATAAGTRGMGLTLGAVLGCA